MFEFDFRVVVDYTKDVYKVDGGANEGIDDDGTEITPLLIVNFGIPKNPKWSTISMDLKDVVRHELEHLTQSGDNVVGVVRDPKDSRLDRPGKQMADDKFIRDMIDADMLLDAQKHPENYKELLVRVTGYNAYFTTIGRELQNEIIAREMHKI